MDKPEAFRFRVRKAMLVWNVVAIATFAAGLAYASCITAMSAPSRITALDRAGVLDETKLRESYPSLAVNLRRDLGMWIAEKERQAAYFAVGIGIAVAAVNLLLILMFCRPERNPSITSHPRRRPGGPDAP